MTNEQKREEKQKLLLERLQEMSYFDDEFMTKCLEDYSKGVELMLRIIMNDAKLVVKEAQVQAVIKNLQGRSIRMDVKTNDVSKKQYDVDHFVPWSFVMNDELWNLMPMNFSENIRMFVSYMLMVPRWKTTAMTHNCLTEIILILKIILIK